MTAAQMWEKSEIVGEYEAWSFGDDPDGLAALVLSGKKTATASAYPLYALEGEPLPQPGEYGVILDSRDRAVCVIRTTRVYVVPFDRVTAEHAAAEGEGDRSLNGWRRAHRAFFEEEMSLNGWRRAHRAFFEEEMRRAGMAFDERMPVVCEEFEKVYPKEEP